MLNRVVYTVVFAAVVIWLFYGDVDPAIAKAFACFAIIAWRATFELQSALNHEQEKLIKAHNGSIMNLTEIVQNLMENGRVLRARIEALEGKAKTRC